MVNTGHSVLAARFSDVQGTAFQPAFTYLSENNIVQGYSDGTGRPDAAINRAEALKVLVTPQPQMQTRIQWYQRNLPPIPLFLDVDQTAWYTPFLEVAFESQVVTGYPDGTFRPANSVTVEEALALLLRTYQIPLDPQFKQSDRIQNADGNWYTPFVNTAVSKNLVRPGAKLYLGSAISRGEFFSILYRLDSIVKSNQPAFVDPTVGQPVIVQSSSVSSVADAPPAQNQPPVNQQPVQNSSVSQNYPPVQNTGNQGTSNSQYLSTLPFAITIPSVGIYDLAIVRPTDYSPEGLLEPLTNGVGHLFSFPGGGGKIMVYGHSSSYPWDTSEFTKIFRKINAANPGDKIYVTYNGQVYTYEVAFEETIPAADTSRFNDNGEGEKLILYTCWPPDSIEQRYLVHAIPSN